MMRYPIPRKLSRISAVLRPSYPRREADLPQVGRAQHGGSKDDPGTKAYILVLVKSGP
jgi:hypothetical protein